MEIEKYHLIILDFLEYLSKSKPTNAPEIEPRLVVDEKNYIYILLHIGWEGNKRIHECSIHIEIIQNKIWIQLNNTDISITDYLVSKGIKKEDIILGMRKKQLLDNSFEFSCSVR